MIKRIKIQNFQSHIDTELEFSPQVNVIIGKYDSGKSAILRAINWPRTNRPRGDSFLNAKGSAVVEIETEKGVVYRIKENKSGGAVALGNIIEELVKEPTGNIHHNSYIIKPQDKNPKLFGAVGSEVPKEVLTILNLQEINVQTQHNTGFLVFDSPNSVAEFIHERTGLSILMSLEEHIRKQRTDQQAILKSNTLNLENTRLELSTRKYKHIQKIKDFSRKIVSLNKELVMDKEKEVLATTLRNALLSCFAGIIELTRLQAATENLMRTAIALKNEIDQKNKAKELAARALFSLGQTRVSLVTINNSLMKLEEEFEKQFDGTDVCPVCGSVVCKDKFTHKPTEESTNG